MALYLGVHSILRKQTHCWKSCSGISEEGGGTYGGGGGTNELPEKNNKKKNKERKKKKKQSGLQGLKDYMSVLLSFLGINQM